MELGSPHHHFGSFHDAIQGHVNDLLLDVAMGLHVRCCAIHACRSPQPRRTHLLQ